MKWHIADQAQVLTVQKHQGHFLFPTSAKVLYWIEAHIFYKLQKQTKTPPTSETRPAQASMACVYCMWDVPLPRFPLHKSCMLASKERVMNLAQSGFIHTHTETPGTFRIYTPTQSKTPGTFRIHTPTHSETPGTFRIHTPTHSETPGTFRIHTPTHSETPGTFRIHTPTHSETPGTFRIHTPTHRVKPQAHSGFTHPHTVKPQVHSGFTPPDRNPRANKHTDQRTHSQKTLTHLHCRTQQSTVLTFDNDVSLGGCHTGGVSGLTHVVTFIVSNNLSYLQAARRWPRLDGDDVIWRQQLMEESVHHGDHGASEKRWLL